MSLFTWLHDKKFEKIQKKFNSLRLDDGLAVTTYFKLGLVHDEDTHSCDRIIVYWVDKLTGGEDISMNMEKYITKERISWHFLTHFTVNGMVKAIYNDVKAEYAQFNKVRDAVDKCYYLKYFKIQFFNCTSEDGEYQYVSTAVRLTPYQLEDYLNYVKEYHERSAGEEVIKLYNDYIYREFANSSYVTADKPVKNCKTFNTWYKNVYLLKLQADQRAQECAETIERIKNYKETHND